MAERAIILAVSDLSAIDTAQMICTCYAQAERRGRLVGRVRQLDKVFLNSTSGLGNIRHAHSGGMRSTTSRLRGRGVSIIGISMMHEL